MTKAADTILGSRNGSTGPFSSHLTVSPAEAAGHAVLERAGSSQAANSGRADVEQPGNIGLRLALSDALQRLLSLMRGELPRPTEANAALLGSLAAVARPGADQLALISNVLRASIGRP